LDVADTRGGRNPDGCLERLRRYARTMPGAVAVEDYRDSIRNPLLELTHQQLVCARERPPDHSPQVIAEDVLAHAVEVEAVGPRPGLRRPERRVLEGARKGAV